MTTTEILAGGGYETIFGTVEPAKTRLYRCGDRAYLVTGVYSGETHWHGSIRRNHVYRVPEALVPDVKRCIDEDAEWMGMLDSPSMVCLRDQLIPQCDLVRVQGGSDWTIGL